MSVTMEVLAAIFLFLTATAGWATALQDEQGVAFRATGDLEKSDVNENEFELPEKLTPSDDEDDASVSNGTRRGLYNAKADDDKGKAFARFVGYPQNPTQMHNYRPPPLPTNYYAPPRAPINTYAPPRAPINTYAPPRTPVQNYRPSPMGINYYAGRPAGTQNVAIPSTALHNVAGPPMGLQNIAGPPMGLQNVAGPPMGLPPAIAMSNPNPNCATYYINGQLQVYC